MYSVPMAIVDFLPVVFYGIAIFILQRDLYNKMSKGAYAMFCAGTMDVFMSGFLKALYKLLYAMGLCDFRPLSNLFFPLQAIGFILAGVAMICLILFPQQGRNKVYAVVAPILFMGTMIFVALMIGGLVGVATSLSVIAAKMGRKKIIIFFILSCIFSLCMGYLSSKDFAQSYMNWAAEAVNLVGQGMLMLGAIKLHKAGLEKFQLREK